MGRFLILDSILMSLISSIHLTISIEKGGMRALLEQDLITEHGRIDPDLRDHLLSHDVDHIDEGIRRKKVARVPLVALGHL
jgi:hypothetical protein